MTGKLLNLVEEGLSKLDISGNYVEVNEAYAELIGCAPKDLIGKCWTSTVYEDDVKSAKDVFQRLKDGESQVSTRLRGIKKNGRKFEQHISILAIEDGKKVKGYYLFSVNVQHQVEARKELMEISNGIAELKSMFERFLEKK